MAALGVFGLFPISPAFGAIAVLSDGRTMEVEAWEVGEERARLTLPGGGTIEVVSSRLERIIDDEPDDELLLLPVPPAVPEKASIALPLPEVAPAHPLGFRPGASVLFTSSFDSWIVGLAARHDLDPALVSAVVKAESNFSPTARSPKGAVGLMQLMPATAARLGVSNRFDPVSSLDGGIRYLRWLADRYSGDLTKVLAAYNAGEGAVDRYSGVPPFRETKNYVRKIVGFLSAPAPISTRPAS